MKQFRRMQQRERALEEELKSFLLSNPSIAKNQSSQGSVYTTN